MISRRESAPATCHILHVKKNREKSYNACFITAYVMGLSRTPCSRVLLENPTGSQLFKKKIPPPQFYRTKGSLPRSQKQDIRSFPERNQSNPRSPIQIKLHFNIILPSMPTSIKWSLSLRFHHKNPVRTSTHSSQLPPYPSI